MLTASHMWVLPAGGGWEAGCQLMHCKAAGRALASGGPQPDLRRPLPAQCLPTCSKAHVESTELFDFLKVSRHASAGRQWMVVPPGCRLGGGNSLTAMLALKR